MSDGTGRTDDSGKIAALERTLPSGKPIDQAPTPSLRAPGEKVPPRAGQSGLDRYKLLEEVGQGGMAVVYRGRDLLLDREVAVKVLHPHLAGQAESRDRLEREAQAVAKLRHENILEIFDYSGRGSEKSFIVTEFIHGTTLRQFMLAHPVAHPEIAELIVSEVARALEAAHKAGVIHRDVKPENVMIRNDGVIKLTDFGIAQIVDKERMTITGQLLGSPAYMAPEHVDGSGLDFRTDVFAVGILLYQLATGELPFRGKNPHEVLKRIGECVFTPPDVLNPRVGRRLTQVITRALAKEKADRYADVGDLRRELLEDLRDAGLDETRFELGRLFAEPEAYSQRLGARLVAALTQRGKALHASGRRSAALELWRRALEIAPSSDELLSLVAGAERQRTARDVLVLVAMLLLVGGGAWAGARALRGHGPFLAVGAWRAAPPLPSITPPVKPPVTVAIARTPDPALPVDDPHAARPRPDRTRVQAAVVTPIGVPAPPVKRHFDLAPMPKAVRVLVDGEFVGDYGALQSVDLDGRAHTVTFENPFCYPETIPIAVDTEPGRLQRRLKWKPATLTVVAEPSEAGILVDGTQVATNGRPLTVVIPPMSDGRRTMRVKVSATGHLSEETEVVLRANEVKTIKVPLRPTGAP